MTAEEKQNEKRQAVRSAIFAVAALIALIALCIAWFFSNNRVNGTSGSISADAKSVELRTYGSAGIHDDLLKKIMGSEQTDSHRSFWYELVDTVKGYFETSSDKYAINWLLSDTSNMGNYSTDQQDWEQFWKNSQGAERQDKAILVPLALILICNVVSTVSLAGKIAKEEEEEAVREAIREIRERKENKGKE